VLVKLTISCEFLVLKNGAWLLAKKSTTNQRKEHNAEKYVQ